MDFRRGRCSPFHLSGILAAFPGVARPNNRPNPCSARDLWSDGPVAKKNKLKGLVIVESPAKARKINSYLGRDFKVLASMGHVRDLPARAADIPPEVKKEPWATLGVNVAADFDPLYVIPREKKKVISELKAALKDADELILATDEDREGESIGWHLTEILKPRVPVKRMVFSEITKDAISQAILSPRQLDQNLVSAQETRRVLDRLYGYRLSPLLWKKVAPKLSAGRVQSVAVRLIVQRELERRAFRAGTFWDLKASLETASGARFDAQLHTLKDKRIATGKDFDEHTGRLKSDADVLLVDESTARALTETLHTAPWRVTNLEERQQIRKPYPPFTTSTLQQEANRKLGCRPAKPCRSHSGSTRMESSPICGPTRSRFHRKPFARPAARFRAGMVMSIFQMAYELSKRNRKGHRKPTKRSARQARTCRPEKS